MSSSRGPSREHVEAVREGAGHHQNSKTYSGSLMRPHVPFLSALLDRLECRSVLDYGCGKGEQYRWNIPEAAGLTIEEVWGLVVHKYDPCWPPYAQEPHGRFDLVICTHTLSLIPLRDLDWVIGRLYGFASKAVFIAEKIGDRKKGEVGTPSGRAIGWAPLQWLDRLATFADDHAEIETVFSSRERIGDATITTRYRWQERNWIGEVAGAH
jgi:hypothetical protein